MDNQGVAAKAAGLAGAEAPEPPSRLGPTGGIPNAKRKALSVYEKPLPARLILARALSISADEAGLALAALIEGGYGVAPRLPTNGMLAAYIEATAPARHHEAIITAIGKARVRWQAMLEQGTAMAMSLKYVPSHQHEPRNPATHTPVDPDLVTGCADDALPGTAEEWRAAAQAIETRSAETRNEVPSEG